MKKYEVLYILAGNLEDAVKEAQIAKYENLITAAGGEVTTNRWGMRKLAYPIDFKNDGYYVLSEFTANPDLPLEIERQMRISKDEILRFMIVAKE